MYTLNDTLLSIQNVSLKIEDKLILRDINLELKDIKRDSKVTGQIIGFFGKSGTGKTQLFKILAGITKPTTGTVLIGPDQRSVKLGEVGMIYQHYPLFEHRSVYSNLEIAAVKKYPNHLERKEKISFYLSRFKMIEHKDKYPSQLSGGQRQRIAIIQQVLCSDHFILMDEPFSGLDPIMTAEVCSLIQEVSELHENNTIIIVSHDIMTTASISNYIWMLGHDHDEAGSQIPGARVKYIENLMDKGFCWNDKVKDSPEFFSYVMDLRNAFNNL